MKRSAKTIKGVPESIPTINAEVKSATRAIGGQTGYLEHGAKDNST